MLSVSPFVIAQTHVWTGGGGDSDWFNAANWDVNTVPDSNSEVRIDDNVAVTIDGSVASVHSVSLEGMAVLTQQSGLQLSGSFDISSTATFIILSGNFTGGIVTNNGTITIETFEDKALSNTQLTNNNLIHIIDSDTVDLENGTVINNSETGEIRIESPGGLIQDINGATINNDGYIVKIDEGVGGAFYMIFDMNNHGSIEAQQDQDFLFLTIAADFHNFPDGILTGTGGFDITANIFNDGIIKPGGDDVGTLEIVNNFNMLENSVLEVNINGTDPGQYDVLDVFGDPELEGNIVVHPQLSVDDIGSLFPVISTQFTISTCNLPNQVEGSDGTETFLFDLHCNPNDVTLELMGVLLGNEDVSNSIAYGLFPNPSMDSCTIQLADYNALEEPVQLRLFNQLGQVVLTEEVAPQRSWNLDLSHLSSGFYFLELQSSGVQFQTQKLVKY